MGGGGGRVLPRTARQFDGSYKGRWARFLLVALQPKKRSPVPPQEPFGPCSRRRRRRRSEHLRRLLSKTTGVTAGSCKIYVSTTLKPWEPLNCWYLRWGLESKTRAGMIQKASDIRVPNRKNQQTLWLQPWFQSGATWISQPSTVF